MEDSELYRTSDRGKTWSPDDVAFEAVTAVDFRNDVGMVLERNYEAGNSTLWKTTDGGETWNESGDLEPELVTELLLLDAQTAIAVGVDGGYRTTDGGTNWEELSLRQDADEVDFNDPLSGVEFNGEGRGVMWEGDEFGELYVSSDRGATLELVREFEDPVDDVAFTDSQTAVAVGASVWRTTDGGESWSELDVDFSTDEGFVDVEPVGDGRLAAVDRRGTLYVSRDTGESWDRHEVELEPADRHQITAVAAPGDGSIVAVGTSGAVFRTPGNPDDWSPLSPSSPLGGTGDIADLAFLENGRGFALAETIWKTTDGGDSWSSIETAGENEFDEFDMSDFEQLAMATAETGVVVGSVTDMPGGGMLGSSTQVVVRRTTDGGSTWTQVETENGDSSPFGSGEDDINDIVFVNDNRGIALGESGRIAVTDDAGASWEVRQPAPEEASLLAVSMPSETTGVIAGTGGLLLKTTDGMETWSRLETPVDTELYGVDMTGDGHLVVSGEEGTVLWSTDGGQSFRQPSGNPDASLGHNSIVIRNDQEAVSLLERVTPEEVTAWGWPTPAAAEGEINAVVSTPDGRIVAAGNGGTIFEIPD
jgi:photosystem II stability/assembly factor-like uncharacterized protein